jgi:hypothetical protein
MLVVALLGVAGALAIWRRRPETEDMPPLPAGIQAVERITRTLTCSVVRL